MTANLSPVAAVTASDRAAGAAHETDRASCMRVVAVLPGCPSGYEREQQPVREVVTQLSLFPHWG